MPQGNGSAVGATYDTKNNVLTLDSQVALKANDQHGTTVHAAHGTINKEPREINLSDARIHQQDRDFQSDRLELLLTPENEVQRAVATGNVQLVTHGSSDTHLRSPYAEMMLGTKNQAQTAVFSGGVRDGMQRRQCRYHDRRPRDRAVRGAEPSADRTRQRERAD